MRRAKRSKRLILKESPGCNFGLATERQQGATSLSKFVPRLSLTAWAVSVNAVMWIVGGSGHDSI